MQAGLDQIIGQDQQQWLAIAGGLHQRIVKLRVHVQCLVGRDSPGSGRPDDDVTLVGWQLSQTKGCGNLVLFSKSEAHIDGWVALVLIFHFGFSQCRAAVKTPVHWLEATVDITLFQNRAQRAQLISFVGKVHGLVRVIPLTEHAQTNKVFFLQFDLFVSVGTCLGLHFFDRQVLAVFFLDLDFDWHAVAIPAWHILRIETGHVARLDDHVLEDLVDGVTEVDFAVGIRWAIVQDKFRTASRGLAHALVDFLALPFLDPLRLTLGQVAAHWKGGFRHIDGIFTGGFSVGFAGFVGLGVFVIGHGVFSIQSGFCGSVVTAVVVAPLRQSACGAQGLPGAPASNSVSGRNSRAGLFRSVLEPGTGIFCIACDGGGERWQIDVLFFVA